MSKSWYILHIFTGYERKIERTIKQLISTGDIDGNVVTDVKVPVDEHEEIKDGKKKIVKNLLLPSYLMLEMDLPQLGWKKTCSQIRRIQGVTGFVGTNPSEKPRPISTEEAKNILTKAGEIKGEKPLRIKQNFDEGDKVKITDGPFASFDGTVKEINVEKGKLYVEVQVFGRATPVELDYFQVEKI